MDESEQNSSSGTQGCEKTSKNKLTVLFNEHYKSLYNYIYVNLANRNHADAEDIVQKTWLECIKSLETFRGDSKIFTWLCTIARRCASKLIGKKKESSLEEKFTDKETGEMNLPPSDALPPDEIYCCQNEDNEVVAAIKRLPLPSRAVLTLKFLGKRTIHISDMLPRIKQFADTEDKVKKLLVQARKELKLELHKRNIYIKTRK